MSRRPALAYALALALPLSPAARVLGRRGLELERRCWWDGGGTDDGFDDDRAGLDEHRTTSGGGDATGGGAGGSGIGGSGVGGSGVGGSGVGGSGGAGDGGAGVGGGTASTGTGVGGGAGDGGAGVGGSTTASTGSGLEPPTEIAQCQNQVYECGDLEDNDGDGWVDSQDPDCLGPCDNTENSLYGGIPGQAGPACAVDCYFDGNSGSGNDECYWDHTCDRLSVSPDWYPGRRTSAATRGRARSSRRPA